MHSFERDTNKSYLHALKKLRAVLNPFAAKNVMIEIY
jgi:hypothetical protein